MKILFQKLVVILFLLSFFQFGHAFYTERMVISEYFIKHTQEMTVVTFYNDLYNQYKNIEIRLKWIGLPIMTENIVDSREVMNDIHSSNESILIVDDDELVVTVFDQMLRRLGYKTFVDRSASSNS